MVSGCVLHAHLPTIVQTRTRKGTKTTPAVSKGIYNEHMYTYYGSLYFSDLCRSTRAASAGREGGKNPNGELVYVLQRNLPTIVQTLRRAGIRRDTETTPAVSKGKYC